MVITRDLKIKAGAVIGIGLAIGAYLFMTKTGPLTFDDYITAVEVYKYEATQQPDGKFVVENIDQKSESLTEINKVISDRKETKAVNIRGKEYSAAEYETLRSKLIKELDKANPSK